MCGCIFFKINFYTKKRNFENPRKLKEGKKPASWPVVPAKWPRAQACGVGMRRCVVDPFPKGSKPQGCAGRSLLAAVPLQAAALRSHPRVVQAAAYLQQRRHRRQFCDTGDREKIAHKKCMC